MSSKKSSQRAEELRKDIPIIEHEWDVEKIYKHFSIDPQKGLSSDQVIKQRAEHGENRLTPPKTVPGIWILSSSPIILSLPRNFGALITVGYQLGG